MGCSQCDDVVVEKSSGGTTVNTLVCLSYPRQSGRMAYDEDPSSAHIDQGHIAFAKFSPIKDPVSRERADTMLSSASDVPHFAIDGAELFDTTSSHRCRGTYSWIERSRMHRKDQERPGLIQNQALWSTRDHTRGYFHVGCTMPVPWRFVITVWPALLPPHCVLLLPGQVSSLSGCPCCALSGASSV